MTQIVNITSESLQATIRQLLPSQQGFSTDLQATNLIQPIIDLTPTAEGSRLPTHLQTALSTATGNSQVLNTNTTIVSTPGFYRLYGNSVAHSTSGTGVTNYILIDSAPVFSHSILGVGSDTVSTMPFDFVLFLRPNENIIVSSGNANGIVSISFEQIADLYGNTNNPAGFTFE